jgi:hypothetical protein
MPRVANHSALEQWRKLLCTVRQNEAGLPGVEPFRQALERAFTETLFNQRTRDTIRASAEEATRRLNRSLGTGCDAAICLRNFVKSVLGPRSEKLREYGMKPRGKRCRPGQTPAGGAALPS